jgi:hypothetical protein
MWKLNNVPISLSHLSGRSAYQKIVKISRECRFNQKHLVSGAKSSTITNVSCSTLIFRTRHMTFGYGMNFLPMIEHNSTDNLG